MLSNCNIDTDDPALARKCGVFLSRGSHWKRLSIFVILIILSVACYAKDGPGNYKTQVMDGNISSIDWVGSVIAVNNMMIFVPPGARIYKGSDSIGLSAINMGDPVTVTYYNDPAGVHTAVNIVVQYSGDFAV
jgi:hypothetical protein